MAVSVGAIGMIAVGGLLIHSALTNQSPLADLRSIMAGGATTIGSTPTTSPAAVQTATGPSQVFVNAPSGGPSPLGTNNLNGAGVPAAARDRWGL